MRPNHMAEEAVEPHKGMLNVPYFWHVFQSSARHVTCLEREGEGGALVPLRATAAMDGEGGSPRGLLTLRVWRQGARLMQAISGRLFCSCLSNSWVYVYSSCGAMGAGAA